MGWIGARRRSHVHSSVEVDLNVSYVGMRELFDLPMILDEESGGKERGLQPGFIASDYIHAYLKAVDGNAFCSHTCPLLACCDIGIPGTKVE